LPSGRARKRHPAVRRLWARELRAAVLGVWHKGATDIRVGGTRFGMGAEYLAVDDLLHEEGDESFVRWLIVEAPSALGWDGERRSLQWAKRPENREAARREYFLRQRPNTLGVQLRRLDAPRERPSGSHSDAFRKLGELLSRETAVRSPVARTGLHDRRTAQSPHPTSALEDLPTGLPTDEER